MKHNTDIGLGLKNIWTIDCYDSEGNLKWSETKKNLVVTEGLNHVLSIAFDAGTQVTQWYVGLKGSGTPVAGDTMASHSTWSEDTNYTQSVRQNLTLGTASSGSIDNVGNLATFTMNATTTINGAFVTSDNTKSGTSGTLYGVVDFAVARSVISGDTLNVTVTLTAASA